LDSRFAGSNPTEDDGFLRAINSAKNEYEGMVLEGVAQDTDQWRAVVNTVINTGVPSKARNFLTG
jgi:hypothetical protein